MSDSTEFSRRLLNAFSYATDDDVRLTWDLVRSYDDSVQGAAIDEHRLDQGGKVWRPAPRTIAAICRRLAPADTPRQTPARRADSPVVARTSSALAEWRKNEVAADADAARVDQLIAGMPDDELERMKAAVLAESSEFVTKSLMYKDARTDRWLKSLIVARLDAKGSVAA